MLIWKPGQLPVEGSWYADGPEVPVEFARVSDGGEVATALCLNAGPVQVFWALLAKASLDTACKALREREGIPEQRVDGTGIMLTSYTATGPLETVSLWLASLLAGTATGTRLISIKSLTVGHARGVMHRPADLTVLPLMLLAFASKYAFGILQATDPVLATRPWVMVSEVLTYGFFDGIFVGKFSRYVQAYLNVPKHNAN